MVIVIVKRKNFKNETLNAFSANVTGKNFVFIITLINTIKITNLKTDQTKVYSFLSLESKCRTDLFCMATGEDQILYL